MKHNDRTIVAIDIAKEILQGLIESSLFTLSDDSRGLQLCFACCSSWASVYLEPLAQLLDTSVIPASA